MPTMKENYEAINAILRENRENLLAIEQAISKIKDTYDICIPILEQMAEPLIIRTQKNLTCEACYDYEIAKTKKIKLKRSIDKETLQSLLDEVSPTKLIVEKIEKEENLYDIYQVATISFG